MVSLIDPKTPVGWTLTNSGEYLRPLVGSEASMAASGTFDGLGEVCMGFSFTTALKDVRGACADALLRFRLFAPIVAAEIVNNPDSPGARDWKYSPLRSADEGKEWATRTMQVHDNSDDVSDDEFALRLNTSQVVNEVAPGRKQHFACHLLLRKTLPHSFFMHGTHAIFDARPLMYAFRRLFELLANNGNVDPLEKFIWGSESSNLVADIVTTLNCASGVPFNDGLDHDLQLPERLRMTKPSLGLSPQRNEYNITDPQLRFGTTLDAATSASIVKRVKDRGMTVTVLFEAAQILATFLRNDPVPEDAYVMMDISFVALHRYFPEGLAPKYITSCSVCIPVLILWSDIRNLPTQREQLLRCMSLLHEQYRMWLSKQYLPYSAVLGQPPLRPDQNPHGLFTTGFGVIDDYVPRYFKEDPAEATTAPTLEVHGFTFGSRVVHIKRPSLHYWTWRSCFHLQMQGMNIYDKEYLHSFLQQVIDLVLLIVSDTV